MSKPKSCAECGLAIERRGLHPWCKALRARRRKDDRDRKSAERVSAVVPLILGRSTTTVPLKWLQARTVEELGKTITALSARQNERDKSSIRKAVRLLLDAMIIDGSVHHCGNRYFLPKRLRDSGNAVQ